VPRAPRSGSRSGTRSEHGEFADDDVRKRRARCCGLGHIRRMELDHEACYRAVLTRDARFDGRIFVAVRTTGIYRRPICPALTPKRENVTLLSDGERRAAGELSALSALPSREFPRFSRLARASNTVLRALALIAKGGLDAAAVDALAARLGSASGNCGGCSGSTSPIADRRRSDAPSISPSRRSCRWPKSRWPRGAAASGASMRRLPRSRL
jgi:Metal binding domain of Ada